MSSVPALQANFAWLPASLALALIVVASSGFRVAGPGVPGLYGASLGASLVLLACGFALQAYAWRTHRVLHLAVSLKAQHYLQACAQAAVFAFWIAWWPQAPAFVPILLVQLLFAYAIDMLITWSRRDDYVLGFGPFPIVFSINLFLVFKDPWFQWQFVLVGLAFVGKHFLKWTREGRQVHIFNPSAFALAVTSLGLIVTGASATTWGQEIAITQFYPPQMYLVIFLVGLPGQFLFGVTSMTMAAVVSTYVLSQMYFWATGVYLFYDSFVPIAVFLGMHLLFTDPSTSPRGELGRVIFGVLYGASTVALYVVFTAVGVPAFYDKLFQVPLMNLAVPAIDRLAASPALRLVDPARLGREIQGRQRHLAYMAVWTLVFFGMTTVQAVGDRHPGQWIPFWREACDAGRERACRFLDTRLTTHCAEGSGWACNEVGVRIVQGRRPAPVGAGGPVGAAGVKPEALAGASFERGCELGFKAACENLLAVVNDRSAVRSAEPAVADLPIVLRGSKREIAERSPDALFDLACQQGWPDTCGSR
ncbi:MAG: RnfABCDGE type electron transport complex subunit D [Vicinamibacterales bacterium]